MSHKPENYTGASYKGAIRLGSKVMVSDPCYGLNTWCQGVIENVLPGNYECYVEFSDEGDWGTRVSAIQVTHADYNAILHHEVRESFEVGVDSGQAGIFDYDYYTKYHMDQSVRPHMNEDWYYRVCDLTYVHKENPNYEPFSFDGNKEDDDYWLKRSEAFDAWFSSEKGRKRIGCFDGNTIDDLGFASSSGWGDGGYDCWTHRNEDGKVVSIRVEFITEYDDEDEDDD